MIKRLLSFVFLLLTVSACVSCDWIYAPEDATDPNMIDFVSLEGGSYYVEYQNEEYWPEMEHMFCIYNFDDGIFLGKSGVKLRFIGYVGYINNYYSNTDENPIYIYEKRTGITYFRQDYDYCSDHYLISGTDLKIVYSDAVDDISNYSRSNLDYDYSKSVKVTLYPEACPQLELRLDVFCDNGMWYALDKTDTVHKLTQAFVDILIENKIIQN